jgi:hypothetical protein
VNWEAITAVSTAFTGFAIVITAVVAIGQFREQAAQRRDTASVELVKTLQDGLFVHAFQTVFLACDDISLADLRKLGPECEESARLLSFRFEMLGVLIHRGTISFEVTEELVGGAIVSVWRRFRQVTKDVRETHAYPVYMEWFQWLAEQLEKRGRLEQAPAHVRFKEWEPKRSS